MVGFEPLEGERRRQEMERERGRAEEERRLSRELEEGFRDDSSDDDDGDEGRRSLSRGREAVYR